MIKILFLAKDKGEEDWEREKKKMGREWRQGERGKGKARHGEKQREMGKRQGEKTHIENGRGWRENRGESTCRFQLKLVMG